MQRTAQRPPPPGRLALWWTITAVLTGLWETSGLDTVVLQSIGTSTGFPLQHAWWLERVLHEGVRQVATLVFAALWVWALWPATSSLRRRERWVVALLVSLSLLAVNLVKNASLTSCPWDWRLFGGVAEPVAHWRWGVADGGPGRCFPGGHASSAFGFIALCLPWLAPPSGAPRQPAPGYRWLAGVVVAGLLAGAVQTLRGAHPPSHTLWTLLICSAVSLAGWRLLRPWLTSPGRVATAGTRASP
ncbi:phosphatase PAP2 family protein [Hydrogenophaga sp.]|uniref:phosphatase PAP2 family protein n=1 Tax=Hydrogenophaga sp. TaxID=1904254 RepID=UPI003F6F3147